MATDKPISGFPLITGTDLEPSDLFPIVDVSNTSSSPTGTTSSVALSSILNNPQNGIVTGKIVPIRGVAAPGQIVNTAQNGMVFESTGGTLTDYSFLDVSGSFIFGGRASDSALLGGKFTSVSVAPSVAITGLGSGTGATVSVVGTNSCGLITLHTGTGCGTGSALCTVTFSNPYTDAAGGTACYSFISTGTAYPALATQCSSSALIIANITGTALTDSSTYLITYQVMGYGN